MDMPLLHGWAVLGAHGGYGRTWGSAGGLRGTRWGETQGWRGIMGAIGRGLSEELGSPGSTVVSGRGDGT